jgi:hypothetical protein
MKLGKYEILSMLGRGAFATVHLARDTVLHREVALKILHPPLLADPEFVRCFENDARAAAQLDHPHIVTIHDLGQAEGRLFIAMQYLPGGSLAEQLSNQGPLPFSDAVVLITQVAGALGYAHDRGFIHRDVKPSNVLLNARGESVLADFGLVSAAESSVVARSSAGGTVGTPAYIAPELWENQPATPATDVYALACVLYEALMGEALFRGDTSPAVMRAHFRSPRLPATWPQGVPPEIEDLLQRALVQDPAERTPTPGALATGLQALVERAADPLLAPYTALQAALAAEEWARALQLAAEIRAQDPDYRDVMALAQEAAEAQARQERRQWATQWKTQALTAAKEGDLRAARTAAQKWAEMAPQSAEAQALLDRINARLQAAVAETDEPVSRSSVTRNQDLLRLPGWVWGAMGVLILGLLMGISTRLNFPVVPSTPSVTPMPTSTATLKPIPTVAVTLANTPTTTPTIPQMTPSVTSEPTFTATATRTPPLPNTSTPPPQSPSAVMPQPISPATSGEFPNPITFVWEGSLKAEQYYQVTASHGQSGYALQSDLLTASEWTTNLPDSAFGEWRWQVAVVSGGQEIVSSAPRTLWFNPMATDSGSSDPPTPSEPEPPPGRP